jgi:hypothetical protein
MAPCVCCLCAVCCTCACMVDVQRCAASGPVMLVASVAAAVFAACTCILSTGALCGMHAACTCATDGAVYSPNTCFPVVCASSFLDTCMLLCMVFAHRFQTHSAAREAFAPPSLNAGSRKVPAADCVGLSGQMHRLRVRSACVLQLAGSASCTQICECLASCSAYSSGVARWR